MSDAAQLEALKAQIAALEQKLQRAREEQQRLEALLAPLRQQR